MTPQEKNKMLELRRSGVSIKEIADKLTLVSQWLKRLCIQLKQMKFTVSYAVSQQEWAHEIRNSVAINAKESFTRNIRVI